MNKEVEFGSVILTDTQLAGQDILVRGFSAFVDVTKTAEKLGFKSIFVADHYMRKEGKNNVIFEAWPLLAALASLTKVIRLGTCVTPIPFYHPGKLAKRVATVDNISEGRVIFGAGAGWVREEFNAYGITFDPHALRIQKMVEGIEIIKGLWTTNGLFTYHGNYYTIDSAEFLPKPFQKPHPPIWLGGESNKIIDAVARYAQGWCPAAGRIAPQEYSSKVNLLLKLLNQAGREEEDVTRALLARCVIGRSRKEVKEQVKRLSLTKEDYPGIIGTPEECVTKIQEYVKAKVNYFSIGIEPPEKVIEGLSIYSEEVIPDI